MPPSFIVAYRKGEEKIEQAHRDGATDLDLSRMALRRVPESLGKLTALQRLYLHDNELKTLPPEIGQLTVLTELYLYGNQLTTLPPEIGWLTKLTALYLHGNPALGLPPEVLGPTLEEVRDKNARPANPAAIIDYYFSREKTPRRQETDSIAFETGWGRFRFSPGTEDVLRRASLLVRDSGRRGMTSSCVLFAFAKAEHVTGKFLAEKLNRTGKYDEAFATFMRDSGDFDDQSHLFISGTSEHLSSNTSAILVSADSFARRVSGEQSRIHPRHLLAALLVGAPASSRPAALERLERMGISVPELSRELREFIRGTWSSDNSKEWDSILNPNLPGSSPAPQTATGISSRSKPEAAVMEPPKLEPKPEQVVEVKRLKLDSTKALVPDGEAKELTPTAQKCCEALHVFLTSAETQPPLTVSVEAPWGAGKSSLLRHLQNSLDKQGVATVWFNPWKHEAGKAMWAAFAVAFERQASARQSWWRRKWLRLSLSWQRMAAAERMKTALRLAFWLGALVVMLLAGWAQFKKEVGHWSDALLKHAPWLGAAAAGYALLTDATKHLGNPLKLDVAKMLMHSDHEDAVDDLHRFHEDFRRMMRAYIPPAKDGKAGRAVVFVDDLDRCEAPKAADLLQSLHQMLNVSEDRPSDDEGKPPLPGVICVLGMDREKVAAAVAAKHEKLLPLLYGGDDGKVPRGKAMEFGHEFLEKFIQLTLHLPRIRGEDRNRYLKSITGWDGKSKEVSLPKLHGTGKEQQPVREELRGDTLADSLEDEIHGDAPPPNGEANGAAKQRTREVEELLNDGHIAYRCAKYVAGVLDNNPRKLKQFVNLFRLRLFLAAALDVLDIDTLNEDRAEVAEGSLSAHHIAKLVALDLACPQQMALAREEAIPNLKRTVESCAIGSYRVDYLLKRAAESPAHDVLGARLDLYFHLVAGGSDEEEKPDRADAIVQKT